MRGIIIIMANAQRAYHSHLRFVLRALHLILKITFEVGLLSAPFSDEKTQFSQFRRSVVSDSATPWTAACQASLAVTSSWSLLKLMSTELVMPSNHFILCCPLLLLPSIFPSISVFSKKSALASGGQSIGASALASVPPMNIQN